MTFTDANNLDLRRTRASHHLGNCCLCAIEGYFMQSVRRHKILLKMGL